MPAPCGVGLGAWRGELRRERVDCAAHFVKLADALGMELRDFKALAAAFGDQALPMQQMQRMGNRLARHAELFRKLVLPDALSRRQAAIDDGLENPRIDLIDQVWQRV